MKLYLIRHGIAEAPSNKPDSDRALTEEGKVRMRRAASGLRAIAVRPDLILTSPLRRARETAEILATALNGVETRILAELALGGEPQKILAALKPFGHLDALALVGHQPDLGQLASHLLTGSATACSVSFKKGAVACFEGSLGSGSVRFSLEWFLTPKQLRSLCAD